MPPQTLEPRMESLEHRVDQLEQLPAKIDALTLVVSQPRTKMHAEFSAVRAEISEQGAASAGRDEALGIHMRVLHEDVIARIALLHDVLSPPPAPKPRPRKKR